MELTRDEVEYRPAMMGGSAVGLLLMAVYAAVVPAVGALVFVRRDA